MSGDTKDNWNANLYDTNHAFVSNFGADVIDLLAPKKGEKILDLGSGTGDLAKSLYDMGVHVVGIDNSYNMVHHAQTKYPHLNFMVGDATNLEFNNEFDAVFSNATLHWVKPPKQALQCIYDSLKRGGRFVAEFGGRGNVQTIIGEVIHQFQTLGIGFKADQFSWYFPSIGEYSTLMEEVGFRVTFAHHFDRPTPLEGDNGLRNWIEMFCNAMFAGIDEEKRALIITNAEKGLKGRLYKKGCWIADYKRIRIIGSKE